MFLIPCFHVDIYLPFEEAGSGKGTCLVLLLLFFKNVCVLFVQSCLTLCNPLGCNPPGSSVHGILQARTLE